MNRDYMTVSNLTPNDQATTFRSSTPISLRTPIRPQDKQQEILSKKALEFEVHQYEVDKLSQEVMLLRRENEQLKQTIQEKDQIISELGRLKEIVTHAAHTLYNRFRVFKAKYYEEHGYGIDAGTACAGDTNCATRRIK